MSSTILYLAIVAIWAGVLVPRWLRREPHRETSSRPLRAGVVSDPEGADAGIAADPASTVVASDVPAEAPGEDDLRPRRVIDARSQPTSRARARTIAARRRMCTMLVALALAAAAITAAGLASWWVVVPPACMLAGYIALLREAARADAELRAARGTATAGSAAWRQASARPVSTRPGSASAATASAASAHPVGRRLVSPRPVSASVSGQVTGAEEAATAQVVDIMSRVDGELYDQYADAKLRAVGD